jgi:hypothetical protein
MPSLQPAVLRVLSFLGAAVLSVGIAGCSAAVRPSAEEIQYSTSGHYACAPGEPVVLNGHSRSFVLTGSCGAVTVNGEGIRVRLARAASLDIRGDSSSVTVDSRIGSALVGGDGVMLAADSIGSIMLTGHHNSVTAPALGSVTVQGDRNVVTTHVKPSDYRVTGRHDTLTLR